MNAGNIQTQDKKILITFIKEKCTGPGIKTKNIFGAVKNATLRMAG